MQRSPELGLRLALPHGRAWQSSESAGLWLLRHEASGSSIEIRRFRGSRLPEVEACEHELRQRTPLVPAIDDHSLVARNTVASEQGIVTRYDLVVEPAAAKRIRGFVLAISAGNGECLSALAVTESVSEAELGQRLGLLELALRRMRRMRIEDRVRRSEP